MARIPYPARPATPLDRLPAPLNAFRMLSHAEALTGPAIDLGLALLGSTALTPQLREMVILAVAARTGCHYEILQHTPIALDAGVTPVQLATLTALRPCHPPQFTDAEAAALSAAAELTTNRTLAPPALSALQRHYTNREIVELTVTVGYYAMLAGLMNGLDVDLDPAGEHFLPLANHREGNTGG